MKIKIGQNFLITTDNWFFAPDGEQYRAVWGKVTAILDSTKTLGVTTNDKSTNWYVVIGNMVVAGCQIHYAIQADNVSFAPTETRIEHEGKHSFHQNRIGQIYNANEELGKDNG